MSNDDFVFRVLACCRSKYYLNILEAMYTHVLKPGLCKQTSFVENLSVFKHAHSTHSQKHTEQSVNHVHTSTPFTHIHTTLTIDILDFTLRCVYSRRSWFALFCPLYTSEEKGRKTSSRKYALCSETCCVCVLSLSFSRLDRGK